MVGSDKLHLRTDQAVNMTDGEYLRAERIAIKVASGIPEPEAIEQTAREFGVHGTNSAASMPLHQRDYLL